VDDLDGGSADTTGDHSVFRGPEPQVRSFADQETLAQYAVMTGVSCGINGP
jgi:hypothetical protein